jgi:hypothetical protein
MPRMLFSPEMPGTLQVFYLMRRVMVNWANALSPLYNSKKTEGFAILLHFKF